MNVQGQVNISANAFIKLHTHKIDYTMVLWPPKYLFGKKRDSAYSSGHRIYTTASSSLYADGEPPTSFHPDYMQLINYERLQRTPQFPVYVSRPLADSHSYDGRMRNRRRFQLLEPPRSPLQQPTRDGFGRALEGGGGRGQKQRSKRDFYNALLDKGIGRTLQLAWKPKMA